MPETLSEILGRGHAAFNREDAAAIKQLGTADVEWGSTGVFPGVENEYRGPEAMVEWMEAIRSVWGEFEVSLDEVFHEGQETLVVSERLRGRGAGSGVEVEMTVFAVYWFESDKVRRRQAFTERDEALAAAGLTE